MIPLPEVIQRASDEWDRRVRRNKILADGNRKMEAYTIPAGEIGPFPILVDPGQPRGVVTLVSRSQVAHIMGLDIVRQFDYIANCQRDLMELGHA